MRTGRIKQYLPILTVIVILALPDTQAAAINWSAVGSWALNWLRNLAFYLILGVLAIWLIPKLLTRWSEVARRSPIKSFGVGIVILVAGYAALVILFVLILALGIFFYSFQFSNLSGILLGLGLPATGLAFGVVNFFVAYVSKLVIVFLIGKLILESLYSKALKYNFWPLLAGLAIYLLLRAIPWLGWAIGSVATLVGLGAIWLGSFGRPVAVEAPVETSPSVEPAAPAVERQPLEEGSNPQIPATEPAAIQDPVVIEALAPASEQPEEPENPIESDLANETVSHAAINPEENA